MFSPISRVIGNLISSLPTAETIKINSTKIVALAAIASVGYLFIQNYITREVERQITDAHTKLSDDIRSVLTNITNATSQNVENLAKIKTIIDARLTHMDQNIDDRLKQMRQNIDAQSTFILQNWNNQFARRNHQFSLPSSTSELTHAAKRTGIAQSPQPPAALTTNIEPRTRPQNRASITNSRPTPPTYSDPTLKTETTSVFSQLFT